MKPQLTGRTARAVGVAALSMALLSACHTDKVRTAPGVEAPATAEPATAAPATAAPAPAPATPPGEPAPAPEPTPPGSADHTTVEPFVVKGRITDAHGNPIPGVEAWADNTLFSNSNAYGTSDADGYYRIPVQLDAASWRMRGTHTVRWEGELYHFHLAVDPTTFISAEGAIRDYVWLLSGVRDATVDLYYGADVYFLEDFNSYDIEDANWVHFTFVPEGPLIDGSEGETLTHNGNDWWINDIPVGRYRVSAELRPPGQPVQPLMIRIQAEGEYAPSVSAGFKANLLSGAKQSFEIRLP